MDAQRCEVNLKAMSAMGYAAVALSPADLTYTDAYLRRQRSVARFPFLAPGATLDTGTQPFIVEQVGQHTIAFVAGGACEEAVSQADVIVGLGDPEDPAGMDVVICPDAVDARVSETGTLSVGCKSEGKTLGLLALYLDANGNPALHYATELALDWRRR